MVTVLCIKISGQIEKYTFNRIAQSTGSGNVTMVMETHSGLECARRCIRSQECDHVTMTAGNHGKVTCQLVSSGGQHGWTFTEP